MKCIINDMITDNTKKASIVYVLRVLEEYSDENHYLTQKEIIAKIESLYNLSLERKSIAYSLQLLSDLNFDINKNPSGGFALLSRTFDKSEISFLIDALFSSKPLDGKMAIDLSKKVSSCLSKYERKSYDYIYKSNDINRSNNQEIFLNIELINEAIKNNKKISFEYLSYDEDIKPIHKWNDKKYYVNPYYLVNSLSRYYLLGNYDKYDAISIYRVDYMFHIQILNEERKLMEEIPEYGKNFSISQYLNNHIYIFGGKVIDAEIIINDSWAINYVVDWFGKNAIIKKIDDKIHAFIKCNERAFFYWAMQYGEHIEVVSPKEIRERIKATIKNMEEKYYG